MFIHDSWFIFISLLVKSYFTSNPFSNRFVNKANGGEIQANKMFWKQMSWKTFAQEHIKKIQTWN
jgi:hypothetical protein